MKSLADAILTHCANVAPLLETLSDRIAASAKPAAGAIDPEKALSNARLFLDALVAFYEDADRAAYFPHAADKTIADPLAALLTHLQSFQQGPTPQLAVAAITSADQMYAAGLRLGLISFGLPSNDLKALVADLTATRKSARKLLTGVEEKRDELLAKAAAAAAQIQESFTVQTGQLRADLAAAVEESVRRQADLEAVAEAVAKFREDLLASQESVGAISDAVAKNRADADAAATAAAEFASSAKADMSAAKDARARIKDELDAAIKFYEEIEAHQSAMRETQKGANAQFNELSTKYEGLHASLEERTKEIVSRNEALQAEIEKHLQKSIGASLFHAFDTRRQNLGFGKWMWAATLAGSVFAGGLLTWWLADSIKGASVEPAFFVKLSALIPVSFAIFFAARQYSSERRTEEEYAFKSAISVSLEPYKNLLNRMRSDGHEEQAAFVEKLLLEVFDNPVKRVYADGRGVDSESKKERIKELKLLLGVAKTIDPEWAKRLLDTYAEFLGFPVRLAK